MKKILIGFLSVVILVIVGIRIWYVNKDVDHPPVHTFNMGEEVAIEEDIFLDDTENSDGYTITVHRGEMMSYEEFLAKYHYQNSASSPLFEEGDSSFPEMVYELHVTVKNTNTIEDDPNDETSFGFFDYHLVGTDFLLQISRELNEIANPALKDNEMMSFRLRPETEMDFHLPYYFAPSSKIEPIEVKDIRKDHIYLVVSLYPNVKRILIE
ncbi:DUF5028 domain-containing protein [Lederbergia sp. NSJ-179]|uniref:DUF5028 domain-containing protein n=1 Tax=Lederbergia sp. NSJ-179 TaxID=2931402 RepID=UPI001FD074E0|nr:DUF5028 domain-containing protein [Lederbergia sp. NSJ-179]MCJ7839337.1 DUF5028 domain-containing protein [Lederbergia sp. NSJ-179]